MTRVLVHPAAAFEIADAVRSYDATRPGLGSGFLEQIDACMRNLQDFPELAASVLPGYRRAVVQRFPFIVVYRIVADEVQVLALFPAQADPARLLSRLLAPTET